MISGSRIKGNIISAIVLFIVALRLLSSEISLLRELDGASQKLIILWLVLGFVQIRLRVEYEIFVLRIDMAKCMLLRGIEFQIFYRMIGQFLHS